MISAAPCRCCGKRWSKPGAIPLLDALRSARRVTWEARKLKRRLLGPR